MSEIVLPPDLRPVIVDDTPSVLLLARMNFRGYGIIPKEFSDSSTALDYLLSIKNFDPKRDLVITDYDVPPMSGPIFAQRIRSEVHSEARILVVSGRMPEEIEADFPCLFNIKKKKPYSPKDLIVAISSLAK